MKVGYMWVAEHPFLLNDYRWFCSHHMPLFAVLKDFTPAVLCTPNRSFCIEHLFVLLLVFCEWIGGFVVGIGASVTAGDAQRRMPTVTWQIVYHTVNGFYVFDQLREDFHDHTDFGMTK
jgi:hypothetical protein